MCGRFTLIRLADFTGLFPWIIGPGNEPPSRYNIAPTQAVPIVPNDGSKTVQLFTWGLVPSWAKDPSIGSRMINARSETVGEKPAFRHAIKRRRCVVPASGFYEWQKNPDGKTKTPMYITPRKHAVFPLAGIWETWHEGSTDQIRSFSILTTRPNELMATIHDRMPVILSPDSVIRWLEHKPVEPNQLVDLFEPYPADDMRATEVSRRVNSPANDGPDLIEPAASGSPGTGQDKPETVHDRAPKTAPQRPRRTSRKGRSDDSTGSLF
jgi:putative SOS response-associated peptidase YedK